VNKLPKIPILTLLLCACVGLPALAQDADVPVKLQQRSAEYKRPVVIVFDGPVGFQNASFFKNRLARAKDRGADLVIVEIDSPGGLAIKSLEIAEALRDVDWAYTVAFVPREAISGAALMALGCDEIVLGSQARFGDAGPIQYDPSLAAFRYVPAKAKSVLVRQAQDLATSKGRSKALAEAMIDENAMVFVRKQSLAPPGPPEFRTIYLEDENQGPLDAARNAGVDLNQWTLIDETGTERFFTVNGPRAVELGFANFVADDRSELTRELNVSSELHEYRYNFSDTVVFWLNSPLVTGLLILVGLIALYFELSAPGIGAGGLLAGLCAALFFWSRFAGGTSGWLEVILFIAGIIFLLMEVFVIPGFGLAGFTGLILLFVSVVMAGQDFVIPQTSGQWNHLLTSLIVVVVASCVFLIGAAFVSRKFGSIPVLNRLSLEPPRYETPETHDKASGKPLPQSHPDVSVGDWGIAESLLRPAGRAIFHGKSIDVVSDGSFLDPGTQIRVMQISGNRIVVSEVEATDDTVAHPSSGG
jgi:membrane-bound serine protease (ClpP class)